MSTESEALAGTPTRPTILEDVLAFIFASLLAFVLLWYTHGTWQPNWALVCGAVGGIVMRRWVRASYAGFPTYIRRPVSIGVIVLGTVFASWATLARAEDAAVHFSGLSFYRINDDEMHSYLTFRDGDSVREEKLVYRRVAP